MSTTAFFGWIGAALLGALAAPVLAQSPSPALAQAAPHERAEPARPGELPRVLPVWNTASGQVEALLLVDQQPGAQSLYSGGALDGVLARGSGSRGLGIRRSTDLGKGFSVTADLALGVGPAVGLLCDGSVGLAAALGRLAEQCLLAQLDSDIGFPHGLQQQASLGGHWSSQDSGVDLSFGLSWLNTSAPLDNPGFGLTDNPFSLADDGAVAGSLGWQGHELSISGNSWIGPRSWLRVEGRHGQNRLTRNDPLTLLGLPNAWNSTSLSFSGGHRAFSGNITGRLVEVTEPRKSWTDIDISFSWRTPWDARLSVGAKNLLGGPERGEWPMSNLPGLPEADARTPYVRYRQDL